MIALVNSEGKSYKHKIFENHRMCIKKLDLEIFKRKIEERQIYSTSENKSKREKKIPNPTSVVHSY